MHKNHYENMKEIMKEITRMKGAQRQIYALRILQGRNERCTFQFISSLPGRER